MEKNNNFVLTSKVSKGGFTLIELLIVISILALVSSFTYLSFQGTQQSARDARRKSDLKQFQTAIETFANRNNNGYPNYGGGTDTTPTLCTVLATGTNCTDDPQTTRRYRYFSAGGSGAAGSGTANSYVLYASMEKQNAGQNQYWVVCSNGTSGRINTTSWSPSANCPGNLVP
jgi:prepilin-type N-terminal cleavage/methylation domain-containing protein